jgi:type IV fimbrial biogenesis protein FimT
MANSRVPARYTGFSLIELTIVLSILGILLASGGPALHGMLLRHKSLAMRNDVISLLHQARMSAISEQSLVTLCPGTPSGGCTNRWQQGMLVIRGTASSALPSANTIIHTLQVQNAIHINGNISKLVFNAKGTLEGQSGSLMLCPDVNASVHSARRSPAHRIIINRGARIRVESFHFGEPGFQAHCQGTWAY